jgi:multiple sugar transport system substrate-binding protein
MTTRIVSRRALLASAAALSAGPAFAQAATRLRLYWWGGTERAERTNKTASLYMQTHPSVAIAGETVGWGDYWTRLATQAAGRNMPDLVQMDYGYIFEYARRGALLPLDSYLGKELDLSGFDQASIDGGKVDGKIYGVSLGLNSTSLVYDKQAFEAAGLAPLTWPVTWEDFAKRMAEATRAIKRDGTWATANAGGSGPALEVWLRGRGREMYNTDGKFGGTAADMADWFAYWQDMRTSGASAPPEVQALDKSDVDTSLLTLGKALVSFANSNQLVGYQAVNKSRLDLAMYPAASATAKSGQYLKPSQMLSIAATTKTKEEAVKALSFFVADIEAGKLLGVERGIPASGPVRKAIAPSLDAMAARMSGYIAEIADKVTPLPPPPPKGAGEILALLVRTNETVGFKRATPTAAGASFMKEATDILSRG